MHDEAGTRTRILYAVHGYGRGHAARAQAVLPHLMDRYDVRVLAGDDAYDQLSPDFPVMRIPVLRYYHGRGGRRSAWLTTKRNVPAALDRHGAQVVLSDSEGWSHRAARSLGVPRISFDHFAAMTRCRLDLPLTFCQRNMLRFETWVYKALTCRPDRSIAVAFYAGKPLDDGVRPVGPILRAEARQITPTRGEHVLVYFTNAPAHFTPDVEEALKGIDRPVKVYHPTRRGTEGNIEFHPPANRPFLEDLASARAVVATAGNQLISEAIHFGKPLLLEPEEALEQKINAWFIERWKLGMHVQAGRLDASTLHEFLSRTDEFAGQFAPHQRDGYAQAVAALDEAIAELT